MLLLVGFLPCQVGWMCEGGSALYSRKEGWGEREGDLA